MDGLFLARGATLDIHGLVRGPNTKLQFKRKYIPKVFLYTSFPFVGFLSLGVENERADAGRDGRTCLARQNRQTQTGTVKIILHHPCSADHEQVWQPYSVDPYSA